MSNRKIAILPGDGIGPEVIAEARRAALYEPAHGSAPDIAGQGVANPLGAILSVAMMLRLSLDRSEDAARLERAVEAALALGARTADICEPGRSPVSCSEMGAAVIAALERLR